MHPGLRRLFYLRTHAVFFVVALCVVPSFAHAGFGITPPYVLNDRLTRGTVYEQKITLVRSDPNEDLKTQITMNIPGIENWFTIDRGTEFILPKGTTQLPIVVRVTVPPDAEYRSYKGAIRIRTAPVETRREGSVSIALGAQVDVELKVVDKILDFEIRRIRLADLEEGRRKWGLFFPAKIRFFMTVENTGNAEYGPEKVRFDIYDSELETLLETVENTNEIETVAPFSINEVVAELPTRLAAGRYTAKYAVYRGDDIAQQDTVNISVSTLGAVPGYEGYGFDGLAFNDKLKVLAVAGVPALFLLALIIMLSVRRNRRVRALRARSRSL